MSDGVLTVDKLRGVIREVQSAGRSGFFCAPVPALRVFESVHAVEPAGRLFPESKHRSRRVLKKLIRRHGGEFVMKPCSYMMGDTLVAHPSIAKKLREEVGEDAMSAKC